MAAARGHFNLTARTVPESHQHSAWHSPVPYLFGGLAAMLGLVGFALLILACSYWKLSGHFDARNDSEDSLQQNQWDLEASAKEEGADRGGSEMKDKVFEEKIVVIVAGRANNMFLATPVSYPSSSNCSTSSSSSCSTRLSCFEESVCGSVGDKREKSAVGQAEIGSKHGESHQVDSSGELENQDGFDQRS
ncbi:protein GLUTAMINE DUMPER 5-like [Rhodamnia argentea]|uniref:Protein GLUTAMINE DUMPER 5-like n=1 Tax=Rhodamnia argentea TaxID=178133 RepID=A0A8B8NM81_9MYRT|nr:protein GLUTAMINE DUMPER 5-like [Rhodamnia argentea]